MTDIQRSSSSEHESPYLKLLHTFKTEVRNITPQMEKAIAKISSTRTPEGLFEAKNELLMGCFHNADKIRNVVKEALDYTKEFLGVETSQKDLPHHRAIAIHYAMQEEGNVFSVHRLIQTSNTPDLDCLIALRLAIQNHDQAFINSVLFPEGSGRLSHLKIDSRNRISVALQFAIEKGDMEMTTHIITKLPIAHRGMYYSIALYEAAHQENQIMVAMLLSSRESLKIEEEALKQMTTLAQRLGTIQSIQKMISL